MIHTWFKSLFGFKHTNHDTKPKRIYNSEISVYYIGNTCLQNARKELKKANKYGLKAVTKEIKYDIKIEKDIIIVCTGNISNSIEAEKRFFSGLMQKVNRFKDKYNYDGRLKIYAVLGQLESEQFDGLNDPYTAYNTVFETLGIKLLNYSIDVFRYNMGHSLIVTGCSGVIDNTNRHYWYNYYNNIYTKLDKEDNHLIIVTHSPIENWKLNISPDKNCIYININTNTAAIQGYFSSDLYGYKNSKIAELKNNTRRIISNPFSSIKDGYHEITIQEYLNYYSFIKDKIPRYKIISKYISNIGAKFFVVKHNEYYGFFIESNSRVYICNGGKVKRIKTALTIIDIDCKFEDMVNGIVEKLRGYWGIQTEISSLVKGFGGSGDIHGMIIDIDFFNHIMLNTNGTLTFYYSREFGMVMRYKSLQDLLEEHNQTLAKRYAKYIRLKHNNILEESQVSTDLLKCNNVGVLITFTKGENDACLYKFGKEYKIDIKNSQYMLSKRINTLQKLFTDRLLRDWDDDWLDNN